MFLDYNVLVQTGVMSARDGANSPNPLPLSQTHLALTPLESILSGTGEDLSSLWVGSRRKGGLMGRLGVNSCESLPRVTVYTAHWASNGMWANLYCPLSCAIRP